MALVRPHRGDEPRPRRADRPAARGLRAAATRSSRASSARPSPARAREGRLRDRRWSLAGAPMSATAGAAGEDRFARPGGSIGRHGSRTRIFQGNHWLYQVETAGGAGDRDPPEHRRADAGEGEAVHVRLTWRSEDMAVAAASASCHGRPKAGTTCPRVRRSTRRASPRSACRPAPCPISSACPALLLFAAVVIVPLAMTVLLSFHDWGQYKGIEPVFILKNWREVLDRLLLPRDVLAHLPHRAARDRVLRLFGAPEAYILNRMKRALARPLPAGDPGAAADLGGGAHAGLGAAVRRQLGAHQQGAALARPDLGAAALHVHRDRHGGGADPRADALHGAGGVGGAAAARPADRERRRGAGGRAIHRPAPHRAAAGHARHPVGRHHRVRAGGQRLRHARHHRRPAAEGRLDSGLRRVPEHAQLAAGRGGGRAAAGGAGR